MKPIETVYKGYRFRSRLEARWAVFFDTLGIVWKYEVEGYDLDGVRYLPDFWLPDLQCWVEIKGQEPDEHDWEKCKKLSIHSKFPVYVLVGSIGVVEESKGRYEYTAEYTGYSWSDGKIRKDCLWSYCPVCKKFGLIPTQFTLRDFEKMFCECYKNYIDGRLFGMWFGDMELYITEDLSPFANKFIDGYKTARQARFEHGERP